MFNYFIFVIVFLLHLYMYVMPTRLLYIYADKRVSWFFLSTLIVFFPVYILRIFSPLLIVSSDDLKYVTFALFMEVVYSGLQLIILWAVLRYIFSHQFRLWSGFCVPTTKAVIRKVEMCGWFIFVLGTVSFLFLCFNSGLGLLGWISNPRFAYQFHRIGNGPFWVLAQFFWGISLFMLTFYRTKKASMLCFLFLMLIMNYFLGSKQLLINIIAYFIGLWFYKFGFSKLFLAFIFLLMVTGLFKLFFGSSDNLGAESAGIFIDYFDYYVNGAKYYRAYFDGNLSLFGGDVYLGNLWSLVPRAVWTTKPFVYGELLITDYFYPGAVEATHTPAFFGRVTEFADFGFIGLIVFAVLEPKLWIFVILSAFLCRETLKNRFSHGHGGFIAILLFSPNIWFHVTGINAFVASVFIYVLMWFFGIVSVKKPSFMINRETHL